MDSAHDNGLYPPFKSHVTGRLDVGDGHSLYYELSGNPQGIPVVYLHGGPGAGCTPSQRRYFNPEKYLVVQFDQRGAGRSTPHASIHANTTAHLVADIEILRSHLGVDAWLIAGGSWGVTLALAYGVNHAERCLGFVLRGVFMGTDAEVNWFLHGMKKVFPEAHGDFANHVGGLDGGALFDAYAERLFDEDPARHLPAARAWARYESRCSTLHPHDMSGGGDAFDAYALSIARIEAHYFANHMFLEADELFARLGSVRARPATIVQGRYDLVCPFESAHRLHLAWPNSQLVVVPDAGHSGMEPGICRALAKSCDAMVELILQSR